MHKTEVPENKNIKLISMHDEMSSSYLSYAMSVIVSRAVPDIREIRFSPKKKYTAIRIIEIGNKKLFTRFEKLTLMLSFERLF